MSVRDCFPKNYRVGASLGVIDHIGSGGSAAIVRGFVDGETPREVAVKLLDPRWVNTDDMERDFRKFNHPNLLRIDFLRTLADLGLAQIPYWYNTILNCETKPFAPHPIASCCPNPDGWQRRPNLHSNDKTLAEFGVDKFFIFVMEYCPISLYDHILEHSRSMKEVHRIITEVCAGLTAMHNEGILHKDLTIDNILMTKDGVTKISDFGLSEPMEEAEKTEDIKDLGRLAFDLATGEELLDYNLMDEDEDINNSNVPKDFVAICKKAVGNDTGTFGTVSNFLEALNKIRWRQRY